MKPELIVVGDVAEAAADLFDTEAPSRVLLTGGRTPRAFYERVSEAADLEWEEMEFFFTDERCVPPSDPRSNFRMANGALLSKVPARRYPIDGDRCDADGYEDLLRERFGGPPWFDFAVYGLGPDGHTASLFPGRPEVDVLDRWAVEVPEAGRDPFVPRVSLTVPVLSSATLGVFLVSGEGKEEPLQKLLRGEDIPAARLTPKWLLILADRSAAA